MIPRERFRGILDYFSLGKPCRIEGIVEGIGETVEWLSIVNPLWSDLVTAVEESWTDFGTTMPDIKESALKNSEDVATLLIPPSSALAVEPLHGDSLVCLG